MTNEQYIIQRKLNILELGRALKNVSAACRDLNISRQHHYDIKNAVAEGGVDALIAKSRRAPRLAHRTPEPVEARILAYSLEFPTHGQQRVAGELAAEGIRISAGGVRCVWIRHGLSSKQARLKRLEAFAAKEGSVLSAAQLAAFEKIRAQREAHGEIETHHPGFLVGQDTYYVGYIKGVGRIYQQTVVDTYSNYGFAKLYGDKTALPAADVLNSRVFPFFEEHGMKVLRMLTDRGAEFCGRKGHHPYELYLQLSDVEHSMTRPYRPQSNGITEKLNQTIQDEFYAVEFRRTMHLSLESLQMALDRFMERYNTVRPNQGKHCRGRTPQATLLDGKVLYEKLVHLKDNLH